MTPINRTMRDLQEHFADQLRALLQDSADTMHRGGIEDEDTALLLMTALYRELCGAAWSLKLPEEIFLSACSQAYREYLPQYRRLAKERETRKRPARGA